MTRYNLWLLLLLFVFLTLLILILLLFILLFTLASFTFFTFFASSLAASLAFLLVLLLTLTSLLLILLILCLALRASTPDVPRLVIRLVLALEDVELSVFEEDADAELALASASVRHLEHRFHVVVEREVLIAQLESAIFEVVLGDLAAVRHEHVGLNHYRACVEIAVVFNQLGEKDALSGLITQVWVYWSVVIEL